MVANPNDSKTNKVLEMVINDLDENNYNKYTVGGWNFELYIKPSVLVLEHFYRSHYCHPITPKSLPAHLLLKITCVCIYTRERERERERERDLSLLYAYINHINMVDTNKRQMLVV